MDYKNIVVKYLQAVDSGLDTLSKHEEGKLTGLPSWVLQKRVINIGITEDGEGIVIKITPDDNLEEDTVNISTIRSSSDINKIAAPMNFKGNLPNKGPEGHFTAFADMSLVESNNPLSVPALDNKFMIGWGRVSGFTNHFDINKAKEESINLWNSTTKKLGKNKNYIQETRNIFDTIQAIIKRKAFLERRIHRFINEHSSTLLPTHKKCLFEHRLHLNNEMRKADFILEREQGLPSLFIELESPIHKVFTKKHDLTAPANHARQQISEWVQFVENDPQRNASKDYKFLTGPKERLVIIGRGIDDRELLINTKYDGVTFWTYSIMIEEAKQRMNKAISAQYNLLGLEDIKPF